MARYIKVLRETCYSLGMLNDDNEWSDAIQEAHQWATGTQLWELFVTILLFCDVSRPKNLWEKNWEALSEDVLYQKRKQYGFPNLELSANQIQNYCILHIQEILIQNGKSLGDYPDLPLLDERLLTNLDNRLFQEEQSYNIAEMTELHEKDVTTTEFPGKKNGEFLLCVWSGKDWKNISLQGHHGTIKITKKIVLAVASSGA
ncbi:hypothetical protein V2J09_021319 [Rumex salicifolius]